MIKINLKKIENNQPTKGLFFGEVVIDNKPASENSDVSILLTEQEILDLQSIINAIVKNNNLDGKQNTPSGLIVKIKQMIKEKFYKKKSNKKDVKTDSNQSQEQKFVGYFDPFLK